MADLGKPMKVGGLGVGEGLVLGRGATWRRWVCGLGGCYDRGRRRRFGLS